MTEPAKDAALAHVAALLTHYSFDLGGYTTDQLMNQWQSTYQANWLRLAVIEALYQGRYKAISVTQILAMWSRRGQPIYHFNHEFERLVCRKFPHNLTEPVEVVSENPPHNISQSSPVPEISNPLPPTQESDFVALTGKVPVSPSKPEPKRFESVIDTWPGNLQRRNMEPVSVESESSQPHQTEIQISSETPNISEPNIEKTSPITEPETPNISETNRPQSDSETRTKSIAGKLPIDRFTPNPESSEFYQKLKAVAQPEETSTPLSKDQYIRDPEVEKDLWSED